jgi:hypothetical protein
MSKQKPKKEQRSRTDEFDALAEVVRGLTNKQRFLFLARFALAWRRWMRLHRPVLLKVLDRGSAFSTATRLHQRLLRGKPNGKSKLPMPNSESCTIGTWCQEHGVPLLTYENRIKHGWDRIDAMYADPESMTHMEDGYVGGPSNGKVQAGEGEPQANGLPKGRQGRGRHGHGNGVPRRADDEGHVVPRQGQPDAVAPHRNGKGQRSVRRDQGAVR